MPQRGWQRVAIVVGAIISIITLIGLIPPVGKLFGLETRADHQADIQDIHEHILDTNGLVRCVAQKVAYENCPAVNNPVAKEPLIR